jgi:gliding motility-associated protein GldM
MSLPKEPRQKMINIMYLVLTALLALNVSKQIVEAFVVVDQGLQNTNKNFYVQNQSIYAKFAKALDRDRLKTKPFYDQAEIVQRMSDQMVKDIQDLKILLVKKVDNKVFDQADTMLDHVDAKEDFTTPTGILIGEREDGTTGEAAKLKQKYNDYRKKMLGLLNVTVNGKQVVKPSDSTSVNIGLLTPPTYSASEGEKLNWQLYNFGERPLVSDIVVLTKMQNDVRNAEASMVQFFYGKIDESSFKVTDFMAKVIPNSSYVLLNDSFKADIFPSAYIATQQPVIEIDSLDGKHVEPQNVKVNASGIGRYAIRTDREGPTVFSGVIQMKDPTGVLKKYPFRSSYIVAKAAVVISPTKMNVFYAGVDNPVEISVPGVSDNDIRPALSGGSMSGSKGKYVVKKLTFLFRQQCLTVQRKVCPLKSSG